MNTSLKIKLTNDPNINALLIEAEAAFNEKNFNLATKKFLSILKINPNNEGLLQILMTCFKNMNKKSTAMGFAKKAYELNPKNFLILNELGGFYLQKKQLQAAIFYYTRAILAVTPPPIDSVINLIRAYREMNQLPLAFQVANDTKNHVEDKYQHCVLFQEAICYIKAKLYEKAYQILSDIEDKYPNNNEFHEYFAQTLIYTKRDQMASDFLSKSVKLFPNNVDLLNMIGFSIMNQPDRSLREAIHYFHSALNISPNHRAALYNLMNALTMSLRFSVGDKIIDIYYEKNPSFAHNKTATIITRKILSGEYETAIQLFKSNVKAIKHTEKSELNRLYFNLSLAYLSLGQFYHGWFFYQYRFYQDFSPVKNKIKKPFWKGEALNGKTLYILAEQGFGDTIQFSRYIPLIQKGTGKIIVECYPPLIPLMKTIQNIDMLVPSSQKMPAHDLCTTCLSLPYLFKTRKESIPQNIPHFNIHQNTQKIWDEYFNAFSSQIKIGIVWAGNPKHRYNKFRNAPYKEFLKFSSLPHVQLFSLQKDIPIPDEKSPIIEFPEKLTNFAETAACIQCLDLVITIDSSVAHLAASMNKPTWLLLNHYADWRWQTVREDSPWYPSMRIFRKQRGEKWHELFQRVYQACLIYCTEKSAYFEDADKKNKMTTSTS
jgi:tetratricopeptide (TPR) repeat protein